ncbi:hypothetical protein VNO78_11043 [Psophocarpus tetragonolobus]|uniref:Uncharacterized protein n=1 Tax=Psophocarpus tetragonolobus TaxID=3891 RepID=A0AAN9XN97_PSOTE
MFGHSRRLDKIPAKIKFSQIVKALNEIKASLGWRVVYAWVGDDPWITDYGYELCITDHGAWIPYRESWIMITNWGLRIADSRL